MKQDKPVAEEQLDALLNTFFLQENGGGSDLAAAQFVLGREYDAAIDPAKERALLRRLNGKTGGSKPGRYTFVLVLALIVLVAGVFFFADQHRAESTTTAGGTAGKGSTVVPAPDSSGSSPVLVAAGDPVPLPRFRTPAPPVPSAAGSPPARSTAENPPLPGPLPPPAPLFTEAEFAAYGRLKTKLLENILGIDEQLYTRVEEGKVKYGSQSMQVDAFVIRNYAITNSEYKVFLADLVKNGRMADYTTATVRTEGWNDYQCSRLAAAYFSEEQYAAFPVVNISREAVQLYTAWLEKQLNDFAKAKNPKARTLKVRLPYDYEWLYAAKTGYAQVPDCNGYNTIYDPREGLVDKAFLRRIAQVKKADKSTATPMDALFALNRYGMSEEEVLRIFGQGMQYKTADTLYPANIAACSKAGHVSELIRNPAGAYLVMGSCWKSKANYTEMLDAFTKNGGSPYVGFRVVIMNADKGSYKNPFW